MPIKRVFLATDTKEVLVDCRQKYPEYTILGNETIAGGAAKTIRDRFKMFKLLKTGGYENTIGILSDLYVLSHSDYIVCTLTSNICRLAYELQQHRLTGGERNIASLDTVWFVHKGSYKNATTEEFIRQATIANVQRHEEMLEMSVGDIITFMYPRNKKFYAWEGYLYGKNKNTGKSGYFPIYKTKKVHKIVDFPKYSSVN